ncbi:MAG: glycosyltransferase [Myxococcota bacterium]
MRVLIVVPPLAGHVNPTRGVGAALLARGHEVAWCGHPAALKGLPEGAGLFALSEHDGTGVADAVLEESRTLRGLRSVKFFFERFLVPLAHSMVPGVEAAVQTYRPDVLLVDQQALAGSIVARRAGLPWLTSCTTSAGVVEPLESFPEIAAWQDGLLASLQEAHGLEVVKRPGLSEHGVVVYSSALLAGREPSATLHFVGPVATARPDVPFPWDRLEDRPRVLVSLGTVSFERGGSFYDAVVDGLREEDVQVVLVAPESLVPSPPANVLRCDFVPQVALLPHMSAVVSHAGHNTVVETLAAGKPLVVAPIRDDQPVVAGQVVSAGAGVRVKFGRVRGETLRAAVRTVLDEPSYREAAERIGQTLREGGGAERVADLLESVSRAG